MMTLIFCLKLVIPLAARKKKLLTTKEVASILKVNAELITYLRQFEGLPYVKSNNKYITFSEPEIIRWRNRRLTENATSIMNLKDYYTKIKLYKFITYEEFKEKAADVVFLDGDNVVQYLKRQNPERDLQDLVGDIVFKYWDSKRPKCENCGRTIVTALPTKYCSVCANKMSK